MRYLVFLLLFVFPNQLFCEVLISDYEDYEFVNNDFNLDINTFFTGSIFVLCFAYIVRFFTISQTNIESTFYRTSKNIDDAARCLGKKSNFILFKIHIPLMSLSILLSLILVFIWMKSHF